MYCVSRSSTCSPPDDMVCFKIRDFPKHIYSSFFPLYLANTLFGLTPLGTKKSNGRTEFFYSRCTIARSVIFAVFYVVILLCILYTFDPIRSVLCRIRFYQDVFSSLLYVCEIVVGCTSAKKIVDIFRSIDKADEMLHSLKIFIPYKRICVKLIICLTVAFLGPGAALSLLITTESFLTCYSSRMHNILMEVFAYYLPFIANLLMELQYFYYLNMLRNRYKELNKCLLKNTELLPSKIDFELVSTITKVVPRSIKQEKLSDPLYTINQVTKVHMILTDTARLANEAFCFQQLLKIAISFVSVIAGLFLFAMVFAVKDPSSLRVDILFFMWTFTNALELFIIVWISAETCKEAKDCPIILHRIRNGTDNEKLKSLIDLHSLQMYHSKLEFSVCGLFPLDYSLLYSVVAGATTYLVILIQFNVDMVKAFDNQALH